MRTVNRTRRFVALGGIIALALGARTVRAQDEEPPPQQQTITLDFQDADIRAVISALAELMRANVTYGALPDRSVTLRTHRPIPRDSLRPIFMSLLQANGLEATQEAGVIRVTAAEPDAGPGRPGPAARTPAGRTRGPTAQTELFVIRLKHAHAAEVASVINALFGQSSGTTGGRPSLRGAGLSEQLRESLVPPGAPGERGAGETQQERPGRQPQQLQAELRGEVTIVPDVVSNSLLIRASRSDFEVIREAVQELDVRPLQVMIEVVIAEIRRDALTELGLQVMVPDQDVGDDVRAGGELVERIPLGNLVVRIMQLGGAQVDALFEALSTSSDVSILSRPVIVTANNQEAHILVGSERPFVQVARSLPTDTPIRDQVIQFRDVGTKLTVIPTINYDGYVSLSMIQEVSAATAETQFGAPVISTREASTQLLVKDRQTIVIGGLIDRQRERVRSGVPLLKDLPLVGALFGSSSWRTTETELFLFLTPHVLASDEDVRRNLEAVDSAAPDVRRPHPLTAPITGSDTVPADTLRSDR